LVSGKRDLPYAPEPAIGLEMALLRALAFVPAAQTVQPQMMPTAKPTATLPVNQALSSAAGSTAVASPAVTEMAATRLNASIIVQTSGALPEPAAETLALAVPATAAEMPVHTPDSSGQAKSTAEPAPQIDAVTARIMARRGLVVPTPTAPQEPITKKFERQPAPQHIGSSLSSAASVVSAPVASKPAVAIASPAAVIKPESVAMAQEQSAIVDSDAAASDYSGFAASQAQVDYSDTFNEALTELSNEELCEQAQLSEAWWQQQQFDPLPAADTELPDEQRFSIRFAAQVDAWARLIEQLELGGLLRLYLLNSALSQQGQQVLLTVARHQQHLDNPAFQNKLYQAIAPVFPAGFELAIQYQDEVTNSPLLIQQRIEQERKDYVSRLLQQDPKLQAIQQRFAAELQLDTLQVN
jgi:DNA polymerase-3 subunit gamma/tau